MIRSMLARRLAAATVHVPVPSHGTRSTLMSVRRFRTASSLLNDKKDDNKPSSNAKTGSMFGDLTSFDESKSDVLTRLTAAPNPRAPATDGSTESSEVETAQQDVSLMSNKDFRNDPEVKEFTEPKPISAPELLLSPLKRKLYEKATEAGRKYVPGEVIELEGKKYKLYLTKEELDVLKPSVYLKSFRIKYSPKKAYIFLRLLRKMDLKKAITQCHFNNKKIAREVAPMLTKGIDHARKLGLDENNLYIQQIWVGKDGFFPKRLDIKGRGRTGIITHKYVHVRAILREKSYEEDIKETTKRRRDNRPVWQQLPNKPFIDYPKIQHYKW